MDYFRLEITRPVRVNMKGNRIVMLELQVWQQNLNQLGNLEQSDETNIKHNKSTNAQDL